MARKIETILSVKDQATKKIHSVEGSIKRFSVSAKRELKTLSSLPNIIAGAAIVTLGKNFVQAGMKIEVFRKQLEAVSGSAREADRQLAAIREFARTSPLETEDVVKSFVRLRAVGIKPTEEQLKTLGGVATLFNTQLGDVSNAMIGMEKEVLRRLGVEIDRTGKTAIITSGKVRREVGKDSASIRAALLEVWEERFPNAIETASDTLTARLAIMRSNIFEFQAQLIEEFLPKMNSGVGGINESLESMVKNVKQVAAGIKILLMPIRALWNAFQIAADLIVASGMSIYEIFALLIDQVMGWAKIFTQTMASIPTMSEMFANPKAALEDFLSGFEDVKSVYGELSRTTREHFDNIKIHGKTFSAEMDKNLGDIADSVANVVVALNNLDRRSNITGDLGGGSMGGDDAGNPVNAPVAKKESALQEYLTKVREMGAKARLKADQQEAEERSRIAQTMEGSARQTNEALHSLGMQAVANSKMAAKKKKAILIAMAISEGAAAAMSATRAAWSDMSNSTVYEAIAKNIAGVAQVATIQAAQIAAISSAKFATGTSFAPGGMALVGERGPELVNLPRGSQVVTNAMTRQIMNNPQVTYNINVSGDAGPDTVRSVENALERHARLTRMALRYGYI